MMIKIDPKTQKAYFPKKEIQFMSPIVGWSGVINYMPTKGLTDYQCWNKIYGMKHCDFYACDVPHYKPILGWIRIAWDKIQEYHIKKEG